MASILITPRALTKSRHPALNALKDAGYELVFSEAGRAPSEEELLKLVPTCVGWLAGVEPVSEKVIHAADALKVISRNGTGADNLPLSLLAEKGIAVIRAEGANARGVAELAITLMMQGMRHVIACNNAIKSGGWARELGREIKGRTVAVIGCGRIGREFGNLAVGLGARVRAYDPFLECSPSDHFEWFKDLSVLQDADVVSLHVPGQGGAPPLLQDSELNQLADGAIVINTARASHIDEKAMIVALESEKVSVYATDVFEQEPPELSSLLLHPRVITTAHIGGYTSESVARATVSAVDGLLRHLSKRD